MEKSHSINGVDGKLLDSSFYSQSWRSVLRNTPEGLMRVKVRFDDSCRNRHMSFSITANIGMLVSGCIHEEIQKYFPELTPLIKWHLMSTDGPMHYIANTLYHVQQGNLDHARSTAVWPEATDEQLKDDNLKEVLEARLPALLSAFKCDMLAAGLRWEERKV